MSPPTTIRATASTVTQNSVRRARTLSILTPVFIIGDQGISGASPRLDQLHCMVIVNLAPQPLYIHFDQIRHRIVAVVPDVLCNVAPTHHITPTAEQVFQKRVLLRGEGDHATTAFDPPRA